MGSFERNQLIIKRRGHPFSIQDFVTGEHVDYGGSYEGEPAYCDSLAVSGKFICSSANHLYTCK